MSYNYAWWADNLTQFACHIFFSRWHIFIFNILKKKTNFIDHVACVKHFLLSKCLDKKTLTGIQKSAFRNIVIKFELGIGIKTDWMMLNFSKRYRSIFEKSKNNSINLFDFDAKKKTAMVFVQI